MLSPHIFIAEANILEEQIGSCTLNKVILFIMDVPIEIQFRTELYKKCSVLKKVLLQKYEYNAITESLKIASSVSRS